MARLHKSSPTRRRPGMASLTEEAPTSHLAHTTTDRKRKRSRNNEMPKATSAARHAFAAVPLFVSHPCEPQSVELQRQPAEMGEREQLATKIRLLQAQVELLRLEAGLPTQAAMQTLEENRNRTVAMQSVVDSNRQIVSQLQAMAAQHLQSPPVNPLATFIHLPRDKIQRCALLQAMKGVKLRRAAEDGTARYQHLEDSLSYLREERFTTDDGTYHCNRFEVAVYPQFKTARQMYDAVVFWLHNLDISVTEMIDHVSLREDADDMGPTIWNQRMISISEDVGCTEELNIVGFAQFFESHELTNGGPLGVIVQESVDVDDLHPYKPLERTRKDVQTYCLVSEYVDPVTKQQSVLLKSTVFNGQLAPKFPVEPHTIEKLHEYMSRWCSLAGQYLRDFVVKP